MGENDKTEAASRLDARGFALRKAMAEIARLAVMRLPPFSTLGPESCLIPFERVLQRHPPAVQQMAREAFLNHMEYVVSDGVCINERALQTWDEFDAEFQGAYAGNYTPLNLPEMQTSVTETKQIIREAGAQLDGFTYQKSKGGIIAFSKSARGVDRVVVELDLGSWGPGSFKVYLGTRVPDYSIELGTLLCLPTRTWRYSTSEECRRLVLEAWSMIKTLTPVLEQKLEQLGGLT